MPTPSPEDAGLVAKWGAAAFGAVATIAVTLFGIIAKGFNRRFSEIESKVEDRVLKTDFKEYIAEAKSQRTDLYDDLERQRLTTAKIFDQIRENERASSDRHASLLQAIHERGSSR